ncbi:MAG: hypothetical protein LBG15_11590, partial [Dysgonamonadaceae bacterium]|nr:hypothetical protein [Dysgonamonadaceae bacterium]
MKKLFYSAFIVLLAMNFALTSCKDDDDQDNGTSKELAGTSWLVISLEKEDIVYYTLSFTAEKYTLDATT